jgi:hypothetical protein
VSLLLMLRGLTVKLRGRTEAPQGAEGAQFPSARGAKPQAHHGPLQRLLEVTDRLRKPRLCMTGARSQV